jgi:predicted pyridoxine 5'-phosphate oxidase superfamily flavin-nucleotide-binding protein
MAAIHIRFGLPATLPDTVKRQIKRADRISAWMEATRIAGFSEVEADRFFGKPDRTLVDDLYIRLRAPVETRAEFLQRHADLLALMD